MSPWNPCHASIFRNLAPPASGDAPTRATLRGSNSRSARSPVRVNNGDPSFLVRPIESGRRLERFAAVDRVDDLTVRTARVVAGLTRQAQDLLADPVAAHLVRAAGDRRVTAVEV